MARKVHLFRAVRIDALRFRSGPVDLEAAERSASEGLGMDANVGIGIRPGLLLPRRPAGPHSSFQFSV